MTLDPQRRLKPVGWRYRTTTAALIVAAPFGVVSLAPGDPVSNLRGLAVAWTVFALSAPMAVVACFVAWVYGSYVRREAPRSPVERLRGVSRTITADQGHEAHRATQEAK